MLLRLRLQHTSLLLAYLSALNCLARTDYNFVFAMFSYYMLSVRDDKTNTLILMLTNSLLVLCDLFWLLTIGYTSTKHLPHLPSKDPLRDGNLWNQQSGVHRLSFVLSIIIAILKLLQVILLSLYRTNQKRAEHQIATHDGYHEQKDE